MKEIFIENCSSMSDKKVALAEGQRAFHFPKHLIYRYFDDHGKKCVPNCTQVMSKTNDSKTDAMKNLRDVKNV